MGMAEIHSELMGLLARAPYVHCEDVYRQYAVNWLMNNGVTIPVRCKNCKFWTDGVSGCTDHVKVCKIGFYMVGENGYCVFGERKDNGQT